MTIQKARLPPLLQTHASHEVHEARVVPYGIKEGAYLQELQDVRLFLVGSFKPDKFGQSWRG